MKAKWLVIGIVCILAAGCSKENGAEADKPNKPNANDAKAGLRIDQLASTAPLTLKVWAGDNDSEWADTVEGPIKTKFPNITLERLKLQGNSLEQLLSAGNGPDIIKSAKVQMITQVLPAKMEYDMSPLIKKYGYDLNRYSPELMQSIKGLGKDGQVIGLPNGKVSYGLIYNKQLFDRFAVPYPKDGMTWDEAIQLAKRMTREENGVQYTGLSVQWYNILGSQLGLEVIGRDDKANMSKWSRPASIFKQIYDIPGNKGGDTSSLAKAMDPFYKGTLAMLVINPASMLSTTKQYPELQWDVVTVPTYQEAPETGPYLNYRMLAVSPTSEHKDEAFQVIAYLNSDEVQTQLIRKGYLTSLNSREIQQQFSMDSPELKGKNLQAIFKYKQADPYQGIYVDGAVESILLKGFNTIKEGKIDINTALRQMDEEINKRVDEVKKSSK
jgi:multiple sugar transport system substrate-binding protein